jgi:outer membrane receptor for ferrienterochelin and colicin
MGEGNQLSARLYRDVGQLDFNDFVSAVSLADDLVEGGNPDLKPETSLRSELAVDLRFAEQGAINIVLFRHWLEDVIDLVPVGPAGARFDAPGNIGEGSVHGVKLSLRSPLNPLIPAGSLTVDATAQRSRVRDPLTGKQRIISDFEETVLAAEFRQDFTSAKMSWGIKYKDKPALLGHRINETDRRRESSTLDVSVETTALQGLKISLTALSVLDDPEERTRTFYIPDRNGTITRAEHSEKLHGDIFYFTVSGSFN